MHKNQKGVALVEALVAAVIVGIGFIAVFGLASTSTRVLMSSIDREKQNMLANMIYEDMLTDTANVLKYHNIDFKTSSGGNASHDQKRNKWFNSANKKLGSSLTNDKRKIEVVKTLQICDCGKIINTTQKGITPKFNHIKIISIVKYV